MYDEDEDLDFDTVNDYDIRGTYVFDVKLHKKNDAEIRNAVIISRQQLLQEVAKKGFNHLLSESWNLTILRRNKRYRIEVQYCGRPVHTSRYLPSTQLPPFMEVLKDCSYS